MEFFSPIAKVAFSNYIRIFDFDQIKKKASDLLHLVQHLRGRVLIAIRFFFISRLNYIFIVFLPTKFF